ncbi:MAG: hypothetical protein ABW171_05835 [Steroidobacter sp.]
MKLLVSLTQIFFASIVVFTLVACSKESSPPAAAPSTPLVEQGAADAEPARIEEFRGKFSPGGIEANYVATFSDGRIEKMQETRQPDAGIGAYEFRGARLMKYRGAALKSAASIELEFDQQGKVLVARAGDTEVSMDEITAIRDRAQSLRSHAVAHFDVRGHDKP